MFFVDTTTGERYDLRIRIFEKYLTTMPSEFLSEGPEREPGRTDLAHLQLWADFWNDVEKKGGKARAKPRWTVIDSWTPSLFDI